jgi:hypothetical protein
MINPPGNVSAVASRTSTSDIATKSVRGYEADKIELGLQVPDKDHAQFYQSNRPLSPQLVISTDHPELL